MHMNSSRGNPKATPFLFRVTCILVFLAYGGMTSFSFADRLSDRLAPYLYADTRELVKLVEEAGALVEQQGTNIFSEFKVKGSKWFNDDYYFFIYNIDGYCVFHPVAPELVGQPLIGLKDMNGKPVIRLITDIGHRIESDAAGWVFYLWEERTQFIPQWKSSYIRKAIGPDGQTYLVGCGIYDIKMEQVFVKERVNKAAELLKTRGKEAAFIQFKDPAETFYFLDTYIFVMDMNGRSLVDPAYPTHTGRDMTRFQDAIGRYSIKEMIEKLHNSDEAWVQYMWPKPGEVLPSRKLAYVRKVVIDGKPLIVGCDFYLATPIWMKI
jgi:signal transduction histidine kinase